MAINTSTPYNKNYCTLTGTYTGTEDIEYEVKITNGSGTEFKWRTKPFGGVWSSQTTVTNHSAGTAYSLSNGLSVTFTRQTLGSYSSGDKWVFFVASDLKLSAGDSTAYDRLISIDKEGDQQIIAVNSASGEIAYIENINTDEPQITEYGGIPNRTSGSYDYVVNNKLAYIATGPTTPAQVVGYLKNDEFGTEDSEDFEKVQEPAYRNVSVSSSSHKIMTDFVVMEDSTNGYNTPTLIIGFIYDDYSPNLYIYNRATSKVYTRTLPSKPLAIRHAPNRTVSDANDRITGFAVLMEGANDSYINLLQEYTVSDNGATLTLQTTYNIEAPQQNTSIPFFSDFLIMSEDENILLAQGSSPSKDIKLILAAGMSNDTAMLRGGYLFRINNFDELNTDLSGSAGGLIEAGDFIPMSPKHDYTDQTSSNPAHSWVESFDESGSSDIVGSLNHPKRIQRICLSNLGYDSNGENPQIGITVKVSEADYEEDIDSNEYGSYSTSRMTNLWHNGANDYFSLKWITYAVPLDSSGRNTCHMLAHFVDDGETEISFNNQVLTASPPAPASKPLYAKGSGLQGGRKFFSYGKSSSNNQRYGIYYLRTSGTACTLRAYRTSGDAFDGYLGVFPSSYTALYTKFNNYNDGSGSYSQTQPSNESSKSFPTEEIGYYIGDTNYSPTLDSSSYLPTGLNVVVMEASDTGDELYIEAVNGTDASTNLIANAEPWFKFGTVSAGNSNSWIGLSTTQKVFYKCSFLYDGFQESALVAGQIATHVQSGGGAITTDINLSIEITEESILEGLVSRRVTAINLYRADDTDTNASEPDGLYRLVKEIPIKDFVLDSSSSPNKYIASITDDGARGASYEAVNGVPETLGNLGVNYGVNAIANGYMFVGDCQHPEFPDAENFIFRSEPQKYSIFNWARNFVQLDFIPTAMAGFMGKLFVFGKSSMAIINPESLVTEEKVSGIGCLSHKLVKVTPTGLYWADNANIYQASPKINKIGTQIKEEDNFGWAGLTDAERSSAVIGYDAKRMSILLFIKKGSDKRCWSYYIPQGRWDLWETTYQILDSVEAKDGSPILLAEEGRILKMGEGDGRKNWEWRSKRLTLGTDTNYKKVRVVKADGTNQPNIALTYSTNFYSAYNSGTDISTKYGSSETQLPRAVKLDSAHSKLRWIRVKATGTQSSTTSNCTVGSIGIVFKPKKPK